MARILTVCGSLQNRSANRAALDVVHAAARASGAVVDEYEQLEAVVDEWRARVARADAVVIASPEYAGSLAGVVKNALDWVVGSGELYRTPVGLVSAGTSGGYHARRALVQTLTWQGAHVIASLGIDTPRAKSDANGIFTDPATIAELKSFADLLVLTANESDEARLDRVRAIVADAGVDPNHIAPAV
jgi:chromate reductase